MDTTKYIDASRKIYNALGDYESKYIFRERLLYSCTNEAEHIKNVIKTTDKGKWFNNILRDNKNLYIFGAGTWGKEIINVWKGQWLGFLDNNEALHGKAIQGLPVFSPEEMILKDSNAIVLISSRLYYKEMYRQLIELGVPDSNIINIGQLLDRLAENQYFDLPYLKLNGNETFVDVGSLDGMSSLRFLKWTNKKFDKIYCFEPDRKNVPKCESNLKEYIGHNKVEIIKKGAWSSETTLHFFSQGNGTSSFVMKEGESDEVEVTTMDKVLKGRKVTFIKMDIEGAEYQALRGCESIIRSQHPKLAICVYHKPEDVLELPQLILDFNPEYKLYIRHYSITAAETVLYAI